MKFYVIVVVFALLSISCVAQSTETLNKVAELSAEKTLQKLADLPQENKTRVISVVPFLSSDGRYTEQSKEYTKKYVELLNKKISEAGLNFTIIGDEFDDEEFTDLIFKTDFSSKDKDFWDTYLQKFKPKYIIKGNYKIDKNENKLYFENIAIYNNWLEEPTLKKYRYQMRQHFVTTNT